MIAYVLRVAAGLIASWLLMVAVGIAHADWIPALPTIGFMTAWLLTLLVFAAWTSVSTVYELAKYLDKRAHENRRFR